MGKKEKKFNLTVIDEHPEISNFIYRGISEKEKDTVVLDFHAGKNAIFFSYDEGEAHIKTDNIHSMVFSDYMSVEAEEEAASAREDD